MMAGFAPQTCFRSCCQLAAPFPASMLHTDRLYPPHSDRTRWGSCSTPPLFLAGPALCSELSYCLLPPVRRSEPQSPHPPRLKRAWGCGLAVSGSDAELALTAHECGPAASGGAPRAQVSLDIGTRPSIRQEGRLWARTSGRSRPSRAAALKLVFVPPRLLPPSEKWRAWQLRVTMRALSGQPVFYMKPIGAMRP